MIWTSFMPVELSKCGFLLSIPLTFAYVSEYIWFYNRQWRRYMEVVLVDPWNPLVLSWIGPKDGSEAPKDAHFENVVKQ